MHERIDSFKQGGLMSYSTDDAGNYQRAAYYVDRILKGTNPADLPIDRHEKFGARPKDWIYSRTQYRS